MKNKILIITAYLFAFMAAQNISAQTKASLTRKNMSLKGEVKSMKYTSYNGQFKDGVFVKGTKQGSNYGARPTIHTYFDKEGRVVEIINFDRDDVIMEVTKYRYNKKGLLLYKKDMIMNRHVMETWRFKYDKKERISEYRMTHNYVYGMNSLNPENIFFDMGELISGATVSYNEAGFITEVKGIAGRYGKDYFYTDSQGTIIERNNPRLEWQKIEYIYDNENRLIEKKYSKHWPVRQIKYWYAVEGYLLKTGTYTNNNNRDTVTFSGSNIYDADGQIIRYIDTDKKVSITRIEKNGYGDITEQSSYKDENLTNGTFYEYEYDSTGNWIIRYVFHNNNGEKGSLQRMEERILEYY